jgi:protein ImuB
MIRKKAMHWIALQWPLDEAGAACAARPAPEAPPDATVPTRQALGWWALQFTPHVAWVDEALLLEVSGSLRLWGGQRALLRRIHQSNPALVAVESSQEAIGIIALAVLRQRVQGRPLPAQRPAALPLATLTAARPHLALLSRLGLRTWGDVHALPRAPMVRRFGPELRRALDIAWGLAPEGYPWLTLPDRFDQSLELPARVEDAPALLWAASRLLASLQLWLRARQQGVLAFELSWTLDLKRLDGRELPPTQSLVIRTADAQQAMAHLRRLLAERLAHTPMLAPATWLRLRSIDTAPWGAQSVSFLPEDQRTGDPLHVFIERVGARLGPASVQTPTLRADHRPECMQGWRPAQKALPPVAARQQQRAPAKSLQGGKARPPAALRVKADGAEGGGAHLPDALAPTWLLREPLPLDLQADGQPCHGGPLRLLTGPRRVEAGWWPQAPDQAQRDSPRPAARDYYIAQNPAAELLWIYRERATSTRHDAGGRPRWFLQGLYA